MSIKLTWHDLLIQDFDPEIASSCLKEWNYLVQGRFAPIALSKFGDWFLRRPDGSIDELSVIEGTLQRISSTPEDFAAKMNDSKWQEEHLLSLLILGFHERGLIPKDGECYGFAPHPVLLGRIDTAKVMVISIRVWQTICAQTFAPNQKNIEPSGSANLPSRKGSVRAFDQKNKKPIGIWRIFH